MENDFSFVIILDILRKKFKTFLLFGVLAAVGAYIASMPQFMTPLFKSKAVVFPANITPYAEESETEQLLQIFESNSIRLALTEQFDLYRRYEIDPNDKHALTYLVNEWTDRVSIQKTRFEAVEIEVMDANPDTAALMTQAILDVVNLKIREMHKEKWAEVVAMFEQFMTNYHASLDEREKRLLEIRTEKGLLDYEKQTQEVTEGYMKMLVSGRGGSALKKAEEMLKNLETHEGELKRLVETSEFAHENLAIVEAEYQRALSDYQKEISYLNEVVTPEVPDKKAYPVRWLILFTSVFATELLLIVFFLLGGRLK